MATELQNQVLLEQIAALRELVINQQTAVASSNPQFADVLTKRLDDLLEGWQDNDFAAAPKADAGFAQLIGLGADSATSLGATRVPQRVEPYDETITAERIVAVGDLYYIYQHERIGVFRVMAKLKELFEAGTLRLSGGQGAFKLYQFDKREVLRYSRRDRLAAYKRVFGYGPGEPPAGGRVNNEFHALFTHFINEVAQFWRDKRVSEVIRDRAFDPSFGSIATVRRAGLDLRNNLKWASYGHVNVLRVEVMQLLDEAFRILSTEDIRSQFGSENAWDVIEEVLTRYFDEDLASSPRQRMGVTGRDLLRWLSNRFVLEDTRTQFEALLTQIGEDAEEWLTSAQTLGLAKRSSGKNVLPWDRAKRGDGGNGPASSRRAPAPQAAYDAD